VKKKQDLISYKNDSLTKQIIIIDLRWE